MFTGPSSIQALQAVLWLLGLLVAAPVLARTQRDDGAGRLRDALALGIAIPLVLGILHLLYPVACWLVLAACVAIAYRRFPNAFFGSVQTNAVPWLMIAALALVAWPQVMRPILDGDSLWYHLPNAAAWSHAHSLYSTDSRYWWYPPASELFASALFTVAGPYALAWSGVGAFALLGFRIATIARAQFGATAWLSDALAAATITAMPLALQAGTLQNDVWLAAFLLEALWSIRNDRPAAWRTFAITALVKPYGFIFAAAAAAFSRAPLRVWFALAATLALWVLHDALLRHAAIVAPSSASQGNSPSTGILEHGVPALVLLVRVAFAASPFALLALFAALAGPLVAPKEWRAIGWTASATAAFFLLMPLGYADYHPQLATGASLRYAAPSIALGAVLLARLSVRIGPIAAALLGVSAAYGTFKVLAIFWNDAPTQTAVVVALVTIGAVALAQKIRRSWPIAAGLVLAIAASTLLVTRLPVSYVTNSQSAGGKATGVYGWLATTRPAAVGGWGIRLGTVNLLSPSTRTIDLPDATSCATARHEGIWLIAIVEDSNPPSVNAERLAAAKACGRVLFDDGRAVVTDPG